MSARKGPEWCGGEKRGSGIGGTFPTQAWLELACEEIGGIVNWEIKSFGYICPQAANTVM